MDVCIILGSKSDMPVCDKCTSILSILNIDHSVHIASAHRTPKHLESVVESAIESGGTKVFIGMAGMAAALPGVIASMTKLPCNRCARRGHRFLIDSLLIDCSNASRDARGYCRC